MPLRAPRLAALILGVSALWLAAGAAGQEVPDGYDQGLFEVRVQGLPARTLTTLVRGSEVLLPVEPVLDLGGFPREWTTPDPADPGPEMTQPGAPPARRVLRVLRAPRDAAILDPVGARIVLPDSTLSVAPGAVVAAGGVVHLRASELGALLNAEVDVGWTDLVVRIRGRDGPLPAQLAGRRERERAARLRIAARGAAAPDSLDVPYRPRTGGAVLDWDLTGVSDRPVRGTTLSGQLGLAVLGGDLTVGGTLPFDDRAPSIASGRYRRIFPENPLVRQLELGDVVTGGVVGRPVRGGLVTNSPRLRGGLFDQVVIAPDLPPGWDYEVYQSGRLLGFSESGDPTPVRLPILYGTNPVRVRMLGPLGQEKISDVLYSIPTTQLPAGRFEYTLAGGACRTELCDATGSLEGRYGLSRWLTLGLGAEVEREDTGKVTPRPMLRAHWATALGLTGAVEAMPGSVAEARLLYRRPDRLTLAADARILYPDGGRLTYLPTDSRRWEAGLSVGASSIRVSGQLSGLEDTGIDHWRLTALGPLGRGIARLNYERDAFTGRGYGGIQVTQAVPPRWLDNASVGLITQLNGDGVRYAEIEGSWQSGTGDRLSIGTRWNRLQGPSLTIGYARRFRFATASGRAAIRADADPHASMSLGGSLAWDPGAPGARPIPLPRSGTGLAGVAGTVFFDRDGDGLHDDDEPPVQGAHVLVGGARTTTGPDGRYRVWAVEPYAITDVAVDTLRGIQPSWKPGRPVQRIRPTPNLFSRIDIPLVRTAEVAGSLTPGPGIATAAGVAVRLSSIDSDATLETRTFSDGQFYFSRVPPGRYRVLVRASSLDALDAVPNPDDLVVDVLPAGDQYLIEIPPIRLLRR